MERGVVINTDGRARVSSPSPAAASNMCPGPSAETVRSLGEFRLDAVKKLPVRPQDLLRACDQRVAVGAVETLCDEGAARLRVLDVELLVQVEIGRGGLAVDAVVLAQAGGL